MATSKETIGLISADKVEGTSVYSLSGEKVGSIKNIMIDKTSGRVAYATMGVGGILGIGSDYYALPWNALTYNPEVEGYQLDVDGDKLQGAPAATEEELLNRLEDPDFGSRVHDYYGTNPYWR